MKKIILLLLIIVFNTGLKASEYSGYTMEIKSREHHNINSSFFFFIKITFTDSVKFNQNLQLVLPANWSYSTNKNISNKNYSKNDTLNIKVTVNYPLSQLPFYATGFQVKTSYYSKVPGEISERAIKGKVYFTPYNSVEIWNSTDFCNLPRKWLEPDTNTTTQPQRITIKKNKIPISDLLNKTENWLEDNKALLYGECREIEVKGLAYNVLMTPIPIDSLSYYEQIGDGLDSVDVFGLKLGKVFSGSVTARFTANIINDLGQEKEIHLSGIRVKLLEKDFWGFQVFGESITDENGYFTISYSENQIGEGDCVELMLRYKSEIPDYNITSSNWYGNKYEHDSPEWQAGRTEYGQNAGSQMLTMRTWTDVKNEAFTGIHWAGNAVKYFKNNGVYIFNGLRIKIASSDSYFLPMFITSLYPTIHLATNLGNRENTIYHEFGHYVMYCLQGLSIQPPFGEGDGFSHSWWSENTVTLAWTEGWADAVQMILDGAYWQEDNEYGTDEDNSFVYYETSTNRGFNNGLRSEYYIACAIYDLWDDSDKGLPVSFNTLPGFTSFYGFVSGYNDNCQNYGNRWLSVDNISLTLQQICNPIGSMTGSFKNISNYYNTLLNQFTSNCVIRSDISRVFRENKVVFDIDKYENNPILALGSMSSDNIGHNVSWMETGIVGLTINALEQEVPIPLVYFPYTASFTLDYYNYNTYSSGQGNIYNFFLYQSNEYSISDPLFIGYTFNPLNSNDVSNTSIYLNPNIQTNNGATSNINGFYATCDNTSIDIRNGTLELGGSSTTAQLRITDGNSLIIRQNSTLRLHDGSKVIIECSASFIVETGAIIELLGPNAEIIILGNLIPHWSSFTFTGLGTLSMYKAPDLILPDNYSSLNLEAGTRSNFVAQNTITFKPGFHAKYGSYVHAYIDPSYPGCPPTLKISNVSDAPYTSFDDNLETITTDIVNNKVVANIEKNKTYYMEVYPNPNNGTFNIILPKSDKSEILISDVYGKEILKFNSYNQIEIVNLSNYPSGIYIVSVLSNNNSYQTKIIKK